MAVAMSGTSKSCSKKPTQVCSAATTAKALYSTSVLEQDTICYLRKLQEMTLDPRNVIYPVLYLLVKGQLAQSLFGNAERFKPEFATI